MEQFLDHSGCGIVVCLYLLLKACVLCFGQVRVDCTFLTGDEIGILLGPSRCMASHIVVASLGHLATEALQDRSGRGVTQRIYHDAENMSIL